MNAIARSARLTPDEVPSPDPARERIGDTAFDVLLAEVCGPRLSAAETVRALGLMLRLTEEFCTSRRGDLLSLATALARREGAAPEVRAAASRIAAATGGGSPERFERGKKRTPGGAAVQSAIVPAHARSRAHPRGRSSGDDEK